MKDDNDFLIMVLKGASFARCIKCFDGDAA